MNRATTQSNSSASEGTSDSEIVMMDLAVLPELNKGLYCASKAQAAARHLLAHSPFPMSDPSVHQKLTRLESLLKVSREE